MKLRRRRRGDPEPPRRPTRAWRVAARVPTALRLQAEAAMVDLGFWIDPRPPASGPELEISVTIWAPSELRAERLARRRLERQGATVLAIHARPLNPPP